MKFMHVFTKVGIKLLANNLCFMGLMYLFRTINNKKSFRKNKGKFFEFKKLFDTK
jgi:hypothetical protein